MARTHCSERTSCICGKSFKVGSTAEARHRHNFPAFCNKSKLPKLPTVEPESALGVPPGEYDCVMNDTGQMVIIGETGKAKQ